MGGIFPGGGYPGEYHGQTAGYLTPSPFRITVTMPVTNAGFPPMGSSPIRIPSTSGKGAGAVPTGISLILTVG